MEFFINFFCNGNSVIIASVTTVIIFVMLLAIPDEFSLIGLPKRIYVPVFLFLMSTELLWSAIISIYGLDIRARPKEYAYHVLFPLAILAVVLALLSIKYRKHLDY